MSNNVTRNDSTVRGSFRRALLYRGVCSKVAKDLILTRNPQFLRENPS